MRNNYSHLQDETIKDRRWEYVGHNEHGVIRGTTYSQLENVCNYYDFMRMLVDPLTEPFFFWKSFDWYGDEKHISNLRINVLLPHTQSFKGVYPDGSGAPHYEYAYATFCVFNDHTNGKSFKELYDWGLEQINKMDVPNLLPEVYWLDPNKERVTLLMEHPNGGLGFASADL